MCCALLAFHIITGCDSTSTLAGIGKKKEWQIQSRSEQHQDNLALLGAQQNLSEDIAVKCEVFIWDRFPSSRMMPCTADELRYFLFCQKKLKNKLLPPTSDTNKNRFEQKRVWVYLIFPLKYVDVDFFVCH